MEVHWVGLWMGKEGVTWWFEFYFIHCSYKNTVRNWKQLPQWFQSLVWWEKWIHPLPDVLYGRERYPCHLQDEWRHEGWHCHLQMMFWIMVLPLSSLLDGVKISSSSCECRRTLLRKISLSSSFFEIDNVFIDLLFILFSTILYWRRFSSSSFSGSMFIQDFCRFINMNKQI